MNTRNSEDANILIIAASTLKLFNAISKKYGYNRHQIHVLLSLAASAASRELPPQLTASEVLFYSGYPSTSLKDIHYALKALSQDESGPVTKYRNGREAALYSLSGPGIKIARECIQLLKCYRSDLQVFGKSVLMLEH